MTGPSLVLAGFSSHVYHFKTGNKIAKKGNKIAKNKINNLIEIVLIFLFVS